MLMKLITNLKFALSALLLTLGVNAMATDITWVANQQGYTNGQDIPSIDFDDVVSATLSKGTNSNGPKYYNTGQALRLYGDNSITFTGANFSQIQFSFASGEGTNEITVDAGEYENGVWTGSASEVTFTVGGKSGHRRIAQISITYSTGGEVVVRKPIVTPSSGLYLTPQTVTIEGEEGLTTYYALNGAEPTVYSAPLTISTNTTLEAYNQDASGKKSASVNCEYKFPNIEFNGDGTLENPLDVAAAHALINAGFAPTEKVYVKGIVSQVGQIGSSGGMTYYISADGTTTDQLQVYYGMYLNGEKFESASQLKVGTDEVIVYGDLIEYSNAAEIGSGSVIYSINGSTTPVEPDPETYTTIAAAKAAATATQVKSELNLSDVLVTYVNGASTYITDGTDGFLLYGSNLGLTAGQKVNLVADGNLYLYNGLPEQAVSSITFTLISDNNVVEPTVVEITDLLSAPLKYSNMLIKIEGCGIESEAWETVSNHGNVTLIQDGEETVLRDNWNVATDMTFKTDKDYNVTGFVAIHNENVQIYPRSAEDIQLITSQATPASKWMNGEEEITELSVTTLDADVSGVKFTTDSDGAVTYTSSDPEVATVSEAGVITLVGAGKAEIKATTAETEAFVESVKTLNITVLILEGDGTEDNPYTIADLRLLYDENQASEPVWVKGYIVGCANGSLNKVAWTTDDTENLVPSNVLFSDVEGTQNVDECIPVNLPAEKDAPGVRAMANLVDNPSNLGKLAKAYGTIEKYFSVAGLKNVKQFVIEGGEEVIPGDVNEDGDVNINDVVAIINQMAGTANWKNANVNGDPDGTVDINDVVAVINIMANN